MKKVLFVATVTKHINTFHIPYLKWFKEQGYEVHVASKGNETIEYCDKHFDIPLARFPLKIQNIKAYEQLKKIINENKYEIIHCHTPVGGVLTRLAARKVRKKYNTKVIYTAHGFHFYKGAPVLNWIIYYPIEKICAKWTDCIITINKEDYEFAKNKLKKATSIEYVHGVGVNTKKFLENISNKQKKEIENELQIKEKDYILLYTAEISARKNQLMLIDVVKELKQRNRNVILLLAGKDSMNGVCQTYAEKLDITDRIRFLGYRKDINILMKFANLAVSTSKQEGLPVNIMEALCSGLRVVATNCRGNGELINEKNGWLIPLNDIKQMANAIEQEMENTMVRRENYLNTKYEISNVLKEYETIYKRYEKKRTILHILNSNKFSGAENVAIKIIENVNRNKEFECFYMSPNGEISKILNSKNINYIPVKRLSCREIKKMSQKYGVDIIHAHDFRASILSAFSRSKAKVISHIHKNDPRMKTVNVFSLIYLISTYKYKNILMVSNEIEKEFKFNNIIKEKVKTIGNPVDIETIIEKSLEPIDNKEKYDVVFLGRLSKEKDPIEFIEIIKEIKKNNKEIKAAMIGDGDLKEICLKKIVEYNLVKNIKMYGFIENPYSIVKNAKIMCITSKWEGFGLAAIEGLALGIPVIARNAGGLKEIITENCGNLFENKIEAVKYIEKMLNDPRALQEKSKKANNRAKELEKKEEYIEKILEIYEK